MSSCTSLLLSAESSWQSYMVDLEWCLFCQTSLMLMSYFIIEPLPGYQKRRHAHWPISIQTSLCFLNAWHEKENSICLSVETNKISNLWMLPRALGNRDIHCSQFSEWLMGNTTDWLINSEIISSCSPSLHHLGPHSQRQSSCIHSHCSPDERFKVLPIVPVW